MKTLRFILLTCALLLTGVLPLWVSPASFAQGTAFTYQGRLSDGGTPANGSYDLQFTLWDMVSGGTQQPQPSPVTVTRSNVAVANGIFTVTLDFGADAFPGADRFLEIGVQATGGSAFTILSPRRQIPSNPYAVRSLTSTSADGLSNACAGCVQDSNINQVAGSKVNGTIPVASVPAGSASYIQNTTTTQSASNFNISGNGTLGGDLIANGNVGIGTTSLSNKLSVNGGGFFSSGIQGGTGSQGANFLQFAPSGWRDSYVIFRGSTQVASMGVDSGGNKLQLFTGSSSGDSTARITVDSSGNVGVGTTAPANLLHLRKDVFAGLGPTLTLFNGGGGGGAANSIDFFTYSSPTPNGPSARIESVDDGSFSNHLTFSTRFPGSNIPFLVERLRIASNGNVGIGTTSPNSPLEVDGNILVYPQSGSGQLQVRNRDNTDFSQVGFFDDTGTERAYVGYMGANGPFGSRDDTVEVGSIGKDITFRPDETEVIRLSSKIVTIFGVPTRQSVVTFNANGTFNAGITLNVLGAASSTNLCINSSNTISSCSSSLRYKKDVTGFSSGLNIVNRLRPISFTWRDRPERDIGLAAEDVAKVEPLLVTHNAKGEIEGVKYNLITAVLVNAIKEQQTQIERQQTKASQQGQKIQQQERQIEALQRENQVLNRNMQSRLDRIERSVNTLRFAPRQKRARRSAKGASVM